MTRTLRIGTRGSPLALVQARAVSDRLNRIGVLSDIVVIRTSGDRLAEAPLSEVGGKRLFVKEIEDALLEGAIDLAVHSSKDMSVALPTGLRIAAVLPREDPRDAFVVAGSEPSSYEAVEDLIIVLGQSPRVGTGSVRRVAQLKRLWPGATFAPIRGNLDTRLRKLDAGEYDVLVLAVAGMKRLGREDRISFALPYAACVPSPGQGVIAVEARTADASLNDAVAHINDPPTCSALIAERALVAALGGGCQAPIGAIAVPVGDDLELHAVVVSLDGERAIRLHANGSMADADTLGRRLAEQLIRQGALDILDESRKTQAPIE